MHALTHRQSRPLKNCRVLCHRTAGSDLYETRCTAATHLAFPTSACISPTYLSLRKERQILLKTVSSISPKWEWWVPRATCHVLRSACHLSVPLQSQSLQIAHVIREIRHFQQTPYKIELITKVANYLLDTSLLLDDDELYRMSLEIEPRTSRLSSSAPLSATLTSSKS